MTSDKEKMNATFFRTVAWNVMRLRESRGLTQIQMAEEIGISRQQMGRVESGLGELSFEALIKIADFFEVTVESLCEATPRRRDIRVEKRHSIEEKDELKFIKFFSGSPKVKKLLLTPRSFRKVKICHDEVSEIFVLSGEINFWSSDYSQRVKKNEMVSICGSAEIEIGSSARISRSEVLLIQNSL